MCPPDLSVHFTRIAGYDLDAVPGPQEMTKMAHAPAHAALDLLTAIRPDVLLYGCTSATLVLGPKGDRAFAGQLSSYCGVQVLTAASAIIDGLHDLGLSRIGICSPYDGALTRVTADFFTAAGFEVVSVSRPEDDLDSRAQGAMPPGQIMQLARDAGQGQAQAIVMSCTDMRAVECITAIEEATGKPVVSSNQALFYAALKLLGAPLDRVPGQLGIRAAARCAKRPPVPASSPEG